MIIMLIVLDLVVLDVSDDHVGDNSYVMVMVMSFIMMVIIHFHGDYNNSL